MIVMKFGGTSVRNASMINRVLDIVDLRIQDAPVLVSSAMGKTTDALVELGTAASRGDRESTERIIEEIETSHRTTLRDLDTSTERRRQVEALLAELGTLVQGILLIRDLSPRSSDALLSFGERLATTVIAGAAEVRGIETELHDVRGFLRTDDAFGAARPDFDTINSLVGEHLAPAENRLLITQGFIGSTSSGNTTTLGRGGSDFSATLLGAALGAERVEIWTDVNGIMTADPRMIPTARTIPEISYSEAAELAYFGARVIHPATMLPAVERSIPVVVGNTGDPIGPVTRIVDRPHKAGLRAVAGRGGVTIITVHSSRMLNAWGFLSRMFQTFERHHVSVDLIATSEVSVSVSVDIPEPPREMLQDLAVLGNVSVDTEKAVVSLVGEQLWRDPALIRDVFATLTKAEHRGIEMISLGSSDTNLSLVVPEDHFSSVIAHLHSYFFDFSENTNSDILET